MAVRPRGELLEPSLAHYPGAPRIPPWPVAPQAIVAVLGGVAGATLIALLNARRLRVPRAVRALILMLGLAGAAGMVLVAEHSELLVVRRLPGIAAFAGMYLLQLRPERIHQFYSEEEDASDLLPAGATAVVLGIVAETLLLRAAGYDA